jgi:outer membrane lipopolysaccharide assembly protein LptE/RlpB
MRILILALALSLSACGWQWRSEMEQLTFDSLAITGAAPRTRYDIEASLLQRGVLVSPNAEIVLQLSNERWNKRTVVIDRQGRSAGAELRYTLTWQLLNQEGRPVSRRRELQLTRTYQIDPTNALATSDEEHLTREMMRREAAEVLMQQLAAESRLLPADDVRQEAP